MTEEKKHKPYDHEKDNLCEACDAEEGRVKALLKGITNIIDTYLNGKIGKKSELTEDMEKFLFEGGYSPREIAFVAAAIFTNHRSDILARIQVREGLKAGLEDMFKGMGKEGEGPGGSIMGPCGQA